MRYYHTEMGALAALAVVLAALCPGRLGTMKAASQNYANVYPSTPDPALTPGAVRSTDLAAIISTESQAEAARPTQSVKDAVYREYGIDPHRHAPCEIDHLIPLSIGGANDIRNYWPELYADRPGLPGARTKDRIEDKLYLLSRTGKISIPDAQRAIATDWQSAYVKYVGPLPK
jgi:hypothetical protein